MDKFKARSGREVKPNEDGSVLFGRGLGYLSREAVFDAEEYMQAKRDEELGRWRWPVNPGFLVYPRDGWISVLCESTGSTVTMARHEVGSLSDFDGAAAAYFEAHPESKPWHDAEAGEVWVITVPDEGDVDAEIVTVATTYGTLTAGSLREWKLRDESIRSARRVSTVVAS